MLAAGAAGFSAAVRGVNLRDGATAALVAALGASGGAGANLYSTPPGSRGRGPGPGITYHARHVVKVKFNNSRKLGSLIGWFKLHGLLLIKSSPQYTELSIFLIYKPSSEAGPTLVSKVHSMTRRTYSISKAYGIE